MLYPSLDIVHIVLVSWLVLVVHKICETEFQHSYLRRNFAVDCILPVLEDGDKSKLAKMIVWKSTNTLLNNYCFNRNDSILGNKLAKRKKVQAMM